MRAYIPMRTYDDTSDSMNSLERINDIIDASPLDSTTLSTARIRAFFILRLP